MGGGELSFVLLPKVLLSANTRAIRVVAAKIQASMMIVFSVMTLVPVIAGDQGTVGISYGITFAFVLKKDTAA